MLSHSLYTLQTLVDKQEDSLISTSSVLLEEQEDTGQFGLKAVQIFAHQCLYFHYTRLDVWIFRVPSHPTV